MHHKNICEIKKIHEASKNDLTSLLLYVVSPKSTNYEISVTIVVPNLLKFELVRYFFYQTLCLPLNKTGNYFHEGSKCRVRDCLIVTNKSIQIWSLDLTFTYYVIV